MKKIICAVLMAAAVFALAGCKKSDKKNDNDAVSAIKGRGVFVLGLDDSFPPLGFRSDDNEIVGYDIDLAKEVAKRLGVDFRAQPIDWDAKEMELELILLQMQRTRLLVFRVVQVHRKLLMIMRHLHLLFQSLLCSRIILLL